MEEKEECESKIDNDGESSEIPTGEEAQKDEEETSEDEEEVNKDKHKK